MLPSVSPLCISSVLGACNFFHRSSRISETEDWIISTMKAWQWTALVASGASLAYLGESIEFPNALGGCLFCRRIDVLSFHQIAPARVSPHNFRMKHLGFAMCTCSIHVHVERGPRSSRGEARCPGWQLQGDLSGIRAEARLFREANDRET